MCVPKFGTKRPNLGMRVHNLGNLYVRGGEVFTTFEPIYNSNAFGSRDNSNRAHDDMLLVQNGCESMPSSYRDILSTTRATLPHTTQKMVEKVTHAVVPYESVRGSVL